MNFCGRYQSWRAPWIVVESSAGNKIACERITAVWEGAEGLFFILSQFPERRTGYRAVCISKLWTATCCNLKWYREQQSRHISPRQLRNSFSGLERDGWPLTAAVLVYCPRLHAPPSYWPLPSVWVCVSRNQCCLWNLTWCAVERWPDYHWPFVRCEERQQSRTLPFSLPGAGRSPRGRCPLPSDITAGEKHHCCFGSNMSLKEIKTVFWYLITVHVLRNKTRIWRIFLWMMHQ